MEPGRRRLLRAVAACSVNVPAAATRELGSAKVGNQATFVHEIGHAYQFQHTPCGDAGETDPNYPTYEPYGAASIGEYGLDISTGQIHDPNVTEDYMSYGGPRRMSLYQHRRLIMVNALDPRIVGEENPGGITGRSSTIWTSQACGCRIRRPTNPGRRLTGRLVPSSRSRGW